MFSTRPAAIFGQQYSDLYHTMRYDSKHFYGYVPQDINNLFPSDMVLRVSRRDKGKAYQKKPKPYKHVK